MPNKNTTRKRTETRYAAVKALYASDINDKINEKKSPAQLTIDIIKCYHENEEGIGKVKLDEEFLASIVSGVCENLTDLDKTIADNLGDNWKIDRLGPVIRSILRAGIFELCNFVDTPFKVIINEYVDITRSYFDEKEVGFVNGILDKISHKVRGDG